MRGEVLGRGLHLWAAIAVAHGSGACMLQLGGDSAEDVERAEQRFEKLLSTVELARVEAQLLQEPASDVPEFVVSSQGLWLDSTAALAYRVRRLGGSFDGEHTLHSTAAMVPHLALPAAWSGQHSAMDGAFGALLPTLHDLRVFYSAHHRNFGQGARRMRRGVLQTTAGGDRAFCTDAMRAMGICDAGPLARRAADNVVALHVDGSTPLENLVSVIQESRRAGYLYFDVVLEAAGGPRAISLSPSPAPPLYPGPEGLCSEVTVTIAADRIELGVDQLGPAARRQPLYQRADLRSEDVRRRLRGILRAVPLGRPGCSRGLLAVEHGAGQIKWSALAPALAAVWESIAIDTFQLSLRPKRIQGELASPF